MQLNPATVERAESPITTAYALLGRRANTRELLDLAQAAPQYPAAPEVIEHIAALSRQPRGGAYTDIAGLPHLREAFAADLSSAYRGRVRADNVVVTAGCNQAFCVAVTVLAGPGDEVVLTLPYYFNHDMWLRMNKIRPVYLDPGPDLVPTAQAAEAAITARTRAVVIVTPANPTGVTVEPERIAAIAAVAERHNVALILDETYRSFRDTEEPPHALFADPAWPRTLISLHSFSKDLAIPGYRVGAVVAGPEVNREIAKVLDCMAICAPRIGQEAAWKGLTAAHAWRRARARDVADRRHWFAQAMAARPGGFELLSTGGFFAWVRHPFRDRHTEDVARDLLVSHDTLVIPGTAFLPEDRGALRLSVSNLSRPAIADLAARLAAAH